QDYRPSAGRTLRLTRLHIGTACVNPPDACYGVRMGIVFIIGGTIPRKPRTSAKNIHQNPPQTSTRTSIHRCPRTSRAAARFWQRRLVLIRVAVTEPP